MNIAWIANSPPPLPSLNVCMTVKYIHEIFIVLFCLLTQEPIRSAWYNTFSTE